MWYPLSPPKKGFFTMSDLLYPLRRPHAQGGFFGALIRFLL